MCWHPFAGWFSVGGIVVGKHCVSLAVTNHLCKFVRDGANSWAFFFLGIRLHVVKNNGME